jgi:hypothetical protein
MLCILLHVVSVAVDDGDAVVRMHEHLAVEHAQPFGLPSPSVDTVECTRRPPNERAEHQDAR